MNKVKCVILFYPLVIYGQYIIWLLVGVCFFFSFPSPISQLRIRRHPNYTYFNKLTCFILHQIISFLLVHFVSFCYSIRVGVVEEKKDNTHPSWYYYSFHIPERMFVRPFVKWIDARNLSKRLEHRETKWRFFGRLNCVNLIKNKKKWTSAAQKRFLLQINRNKLSSNLCLVRYIKDKYRKIFFSEKNLVETKVIS